MAVAGEPQTTVPARGAPGPAASSVTNAPSTGYSTEYSRFVRISKFGLVILAVVLIVMVAAWPNMQGTNDRFQLRAAFISGFENEKPDIHNARYFGVDNNRQPYSITADLAENLVEGAAQVELERPQADIALEDGTWIVLTANTGVYNGPEKKLDLVGKVNLFHDSGYEFRTSKATIDLAEGQATGNEPVVGQGPFGDLKAKGFRLIEKGRTIYFTGPGTLMMYPGQGGAAQ